jgi:hypothetical protein
MGFPLPLPGFCRVFEKRKWEVAGRRRRDVVSETGMSITVPGLGVTTLVVRNPRMKPILELPILIGAPDSPVFKHRSLSGLADVILNDGMHYHFILREPLVSGLKIPLDQHISEKQSIYLGNRGLVRNIELKYVPFLKKSR